MSTIRIVDLKFYMDTKKEILLFVASSLTSFGAVILPSKIWDGVVLLILGAVVFFLRGYYKKYFGDE